MKKLLLTAFLSGVVALPAFAEGLVVNSVIPSAAAKFSTTEIDQSIIFSNPTVAANDTCSKEGAVAMTASPEYAIVQCLNGAWKYLRNIWTQEGDLVFLTDISNPTDKKIGIGTDTPSFKLTLDSDGGILALGQTGLGDSLTATGSGSRFIWYPRKAAIRAGNITGTGSLTGAEWDDVNIGFGSVAFGEDNIAFGPGSVIAGGSRNRAGKQIGVIITSASAVLGGVLNEANGIKSVIGGGHANKAEGAWTFIGGGVENEASGGLATIAGGGGWNARSAGPGNEIKNVASGWASFVGGGTGHIASGNASTISGGQLNETTGHGSTIGGGDQNIASSSHATVSGGLSNTSAGSASTVGGGASNTASAQASTVGGGNINKAVNINSTVGGGFTNTASGVNSTVSGGSNGTASGQAATVGGGAGNTANNSNATVVGGNANRASGIGSTVLGGQNNVTEANFSIIGGANMTLGAAATNSFVFGVSGSPELFSTPNSAIFWNTNVGIRVKDPAAALEVNGNIHLNKPSNKLIMVSPDGSCSACGPNNADVWICASVACP